MCILIPLLVGLISAILGYLLGRLLSGGNNNNNDDEWKAKIANLEAKLKACNESTTTLKSDLEAAKNSAASTGNIASSSFAASAPVAAMVFDSAAAKAIFGKKIKENDLTVVEGIGPKIKELFHNHDINTWKALSECSVEKCKEVLSSGGERFKVHVPRTWPDQAKLAYEGKWQELFDWQEELDGGK